MVDFPENNFFEEEDDFFAEAFRSVSEIETSTKTAVDKIVEDCGGRNSNNIFSCKIVSENKHQNKTNIGSELQESNVQKKTAFCDSLNFRRTKKCSDLTADNSSFVVDKTGGHRFVPGYNTPKGNKRKLPGPAGHITDEPSTKLSISNPDNVSKILDAAETDIDPIQSSQCSVEELLKTISWKKLQEDVSSSHSLLSIAKNFSVQRVLNDTAKKKLPKHVIVPVLCLYIKKFSSEDPVSVYMDDTGEIFGKVDKEVLELYSNYIMVGSSLILRKITFVCNVMILEKSNLVSVYLEDGNVHHIQNWDALLEKEPTNLLNCVFPITPKVMKNPNTLEHSKITSVSNHNVQVNFVIPQASSHQDFLPKTEQSFSTSHHRFSPQKSNSEVNNYQTASSNSTDVNNTDIEMDEFDELLGNLDEKSFLEEF